MSELNVTFFAFKKREKRFVLAKATAGYLIVYVVLSAIYLALAWNALGEVLTWYFEILGAVGSGGEPDAPPASILHLIPIGLVFALASVVLSAAFEAACLRWLVRGESGGGFLGLTLGADTWRVTLTYLVWLGLGLAFAAVCVAPFVAIYALSSLARGLIVLWMLLGALTPLALLALLLWVSTRLAPAAAVSVALQRFAFFEAWRVTRPYFWPLLGSFVIVAIGYMVLATVASQLLQLPLAPAIMPLVQSAMRGGDSAAIAAEVRALIGEPMIGALVACYVIGIAIVRCVGAIAFFGVNAGVVTASAPETPHQPPG